MVGIVTAPMGCDNVSWGGMEMKLEPPPGDTLAQGVTDAEGTPGTSEEAAAPSFSIGQLLYAGIRQGDSALIVPVGLMMNRPRVFMPVCASQTP